MGMRAALLTELLAAFLVCPALSQRCNLPPTPVCSLAGASASYEEEITNDQVRRITSTGCPNVDPAVSCVGDNPHMAGEQGWDLQFPATPQLRAADYATALANAVSLSRVGGLTGILFDGSAVLSCYGGARYGECIGYSTSAHAVEDDTFNQCGGHGNPYHYHGAHVCLEKQMANTNTTGPVAGASPQVGWMQDGFPLYGRLGPGGVEIKKCGEVGADSKWCVDRCGGYYGDDYGDDFTYRYFLMGPLSDLTSNPVSPRADASYFPFSPYCLVGCGANSCSTTGNRRPCSANLGSCPSDAAVGTSPQYTATPTAGMADIHIVAGTVDVRNSDVDWSNYDGCAQVQTSNGVIHGSCNPVRPIDAHAPGAAVLAASVVALSILVH